MGKFKYFFISSGLKKPEDIKKYLNLPIHYISLGDLTKNIESIDFSLNIS